MPGYNAKIADSALALKAAGLVAASAAGSLILDVGDGYVKGVLMANVTALEIATGNEFYGLILQGSPDAAFGTAGNIVELAQISIGAKGARLSDADKDDTVGLYEMLVHNRWNGTTFRYLRIYTVVAGTIATGINYDARLSVDN